MAVVKQNKRNPIESGGPLKLDIADKIDFIAPERDVPFLRMLGWGASAEEIASASKGANSLQKACTEMEHKWLNDTLVPSQGTTTASHTSGGATITVSAAESLYLKVSDIIRLVSSSVSAPSNEVFYIVTAINNSTGVVNVTVLNTDQNSASGDTWYIMGNAQTIASEAGTVGKHTVITNTYNYTQIFQDDVVVSGSDESVEQYGITDPTARELDKTFQRLIVHFERATTYGYRSSALPSDILTPVRMGGFFYFTRVASGGLTKDLAGDPITERAFDDALDQMWRAGGIPDIVMCNSVGLREMRKFLRPFVKTERTERSAGLILDKYETAIGTEIDVVLNRHLGDGDFLLITKEFVGVGPLAGNGVSRAFQAREIPWNGGDYRKINIRGEYTMEVRNHPTHHMWMYGGATTVSS